MTDIHSVGRVRRGSPGGEIRTHLSIFYLMMRSRMRAMCGILLLLVGGELILFARELRIVLAEDYMGRPYLQQLLQNSHATAVFWVCLGLTILLCASFGLSRGGRTDYTLRRLAVKESTLHLWQAGFTLVCILLLYLLQILLGYGMACWYVRSAGELFPDRIGEQTAFLIFWENRLLHSLLPLQDGTRWLSTAAATMTLSLSTSYFPFLRRQNKLPVMPLIVSALYVSCMATVTYHSPGTNLVYTAFFAGAVCRMIPVILRGGWRHEEEA